jgi:adenylate cyclase
MYLISTASGNAPEIKDWLVKRGLAGDTVRRLVAGLCQRLLTAGLPLLRAFVGLQTRHSLYAGYAYVWRDGVAQFAIDAYLRQGSENKYFLGSPFHYMRENRLLYFLQKFKAPVETNHPIYRTFREEGGADYYVRLFLFGGAKGPTRENDVIIFLLFHPPGGMTEGKIAKLETLLVVFAPAARCASTQATALSVASTCLGKVAGQRVMDRDIERAPASAMQAVIYYVDLRGFTPLAEKIPGLALLSTVDDYLDAMAGGVLRRGGEVLKFLGDGVLAVFEITNDDTKCRVACRQGIAAGQDAFAAIKALIATWEAAGQPTMELHLILHIGDVLYGNVGDAERLDFTVIGPAVNEASRIEAMCRELDRSWLVSEAFRQSARHCTDQLEAMSRYQLRGLSGQRALYSWPLSGWKAP